MSEEEMQRKMEFVVEQQAQFAAEIQISQERQAKTDKKLDKLADKLDKLADKVDKLTDIVAATVGAIDRLTDAQARTERRLVDLQANTERKFVELAERQAATDERLNVLINVVERYISRKRNGNEPSA